MYLATAIIGPLHRHGHELGGPPEARAAPGPCQPLHRDPPGQEVPHDRLREPLRWFGPSVVVLPS
eukprot:3239782-Alexandrium_andersonii.AAC.1